MPKVRPRRAYHHGDLRRALIDAALEAIAEEGVARFTLRDAARRAGVSPAAPYRHFADKEALVAAVADECVARLGAALEAALATAGDDPVARFRASGVAYVRFAVENPQVFRVLGLAGVTAHVPADKRRAAEDFDATMLRGLEASQKAGRLAGGDVALLHLAARALVHGLAWLIVEGQDGLAGMTPDAAAKLAEQVTQVFGKGLRRG